MVGVMSEILFIMLNGEWKIKYIKCYFLCYVFIILIKN